MGPEHTLLLECQRLQAQWTPPSAVRVPGKRTAAQLAAGAEIPRPPPSPRLRYRQRAQAATARGPGQAQKSVDNPDTPNTSVSCSHRNRSTGDRTTTILDLCPSCGHGLQPTPPRAVVQQIEIHEAPLSDRRALQSPRRGAPLPEAALCTLPWTIRTRRPVGPRLTTLIASQGALHASVPPSASSFRDVVQVTISRSQLVRSSVRSARHWSNRTRTAGGPPGAGATQHR